MTVQVCIVTTWLVSPTFSKHGSPRKQNIGYLSHLFLFYFEPIVAFWLTMKSENLLSIGSCNGLLPDDTISLMNVDLSSNVFTGFHPHENFFISAHELDPKHVLVKRIFKIITMN